MAGSADARLGALIPPPSARIFERERDEFLRDLEVFLTLEARTTDRVPLGFEISFGGGAPEGEPLAQEEPVLLDLDEDLRFNLRGRIDRVDRLRDGTFEMADYKDRALLAGRLGRKLCRRADPPARALRAGRTHALASPPSESTDCFQMGLNSEGARKHVSRLWASLRSICTAG